MFYIFFALLVSFADQIVKYLVLDKVGIGNEQSLFPGIIKISVLQNSGGAFSIFNEYPLLFKIIGIINVVFFLFLILKFTFKKDRLVKTGCLLVLGGTVGNLIDRLFRGGVIDYIDLEFVKFAVFNLADISIDSGIVLILFGLCNRGKQC